jgi:hypothetical protein
MPAVFFFLNPTIIMWIVWTAYALFFVYLYKQKNRTIITSVSVYKYNVIFMDILMKSFKINKKGIDNLKKAILKSKK